MCDHLDILSFEGDLPSGLRISLPSGEQAEQAIPLRLRLGVCLGCGRVKGDGLTLPQILSLRSQVAAAEEDFRPNSQPSGEAIHSQIQSGSAG